MTRTWRRGRRSIIGAATFSGGGDGSALEVMDGAVERMRGCTIKLGE